MVFCRNCGAMLSKEEKICSQCGHKQRRTSLADRVRRKLIPLVILWTTGLVVAITGGIYFSLENQENGVTVTPQATLRPTPKHSDYYCPGYGVDDIIRLFGGVLNTDYSDDEACTIKWEETIYYWIGGEISEEVQQCIRSYIAQIAGIDGAPDMIEVRELADANFTIYFCQGNEFYEDTSYQEDTFGHATCWWDENHEIYRTRIRIRTDISEKEQKRLVQSEIYRGMGILQDSLRQDSIIYGGLLQSMADAPSKADWALLKLLYHGDIECGMAIDACATVISRIYY